MMRNTPTLVRILPVFALTLAGTAFGKSPNILFIFADDHTIQAIGAYESWLQDFAKAHDLTPNLDRLAAQGALFNNSFCGNSICGPSRATILTGKHSNANGFYGNNQELKPKDGFDGGQWTFPKELQKAGYNTAIFGKWHLGSEPTGFDEWKVLPGQGHYYNPEFRTAKGMIQTSGHSTQTIANFSIEWLKQQSDDQPFLLMCQFKAPHRTWMPDTDQFDYLRDAVIPKPDTLHDLYQTRSSPLWHQEMEIGRHMQYEHDLKINPPLVTYDIQNPNYKRLTPEQRKTFDEFYGPRNRSFEAANLSGLELLEFKYEEYIKDYLRCIKEIDDQVGRLLATLEESGLADNTMVVYSADQGFYLGEHGWFDKRWMYEESLRMPLIVRWPGKVKAGSMPKALVQNIDYAPTFLEVAGVKAPKNLHGESMVSILKGKTPSNWRDSIYYHYYEFPGPHSVARHRGVRDDRYKLMHFYVSDEWELFDLQEDPQEINNVYENPNYDGIVKRLTKTMAKLERQYNVPAKDPF
ncbi:MAG: sulfatase [Verrucomicrobia bacterium]|nr:sulfatase [Verrucomicrobiota bacterium]